jgi:hypothetical protein
MELDPALPQTESMVGPRLVCLGNYTDMFMGANRHYAIKYAQLHHVHFPEMPLVFITKATLDSDTITALDQIGHICLFFISQSFFCWYTGREAGIEQSALNWRQLARTRHLRPLHFWRPLTPQNVPHAEAARRQLQLVQEAGAMASVAVGLKYGAFLGTRFAAPDHPLHKALFDESDSGTPLPLGEKFHPGLRALVLREAHDLGHPTYLHTSCAVALALQRPEFLQTRRPPLRRIRCDPACCPIGQRNRCDSGFSKSGPISEFPRVR